jgi:hypothetical protein
MPHYYIDIRSHFAINEDTDGVDLPNIAAAEAEALKIGERLLEGWAGLPPAYSSAIVIEIIDEDLHPVLVIPYAEFTLQRQPMS